MLNKVADFIKSIVANEWMNYELEFPVERFLHLEAVSSGSFPFEIVGRTETMEHLTEETMKHVSIQKLLHIDGELRVMNEVNLVSFNGKPVILYQIVNQGIVDEVIVDKAVYEAFLLEHTSATKEEIEEVIRWKHEKDFKVQASSDHILLYDGKRLYSTTIHDMPEMDVW